MISCVLALSWENERSHTQATPPWSSPYCKLDITVRAPHSVCCVSCCWTVTLTKCFCVNMEPASAFLLLFVLCAMFTYSFMRLCYWQEDEWKGCCECLSDVWVFFFNWEERIPGSLEKLPFTSYPSALWLILHRGQSSSSRSHLSFKPAIIYKVQEVTAKKNLTPQRKR